jgi:hypothetical protein
VIVVTSLVTLLINKFTNSVIATDFLGSLHTMAEGREAVDFHPSNCKKSRTRSLDPSHWKAKVQRPSFFKMPMW